MVPPVSKSTIDRLRPLRVPAWVRAGFRMTHAVSTPAAATLARRLFFSAPRIPRRPRESELLAAAEAFQIGRGSGRLAGWVWGEGPSILLVHGWGGQAGQLAWLGSELALSGFRAIALDLPGHGDSAGQLSSLVHCANALHQAAAVFGAPRGIVAHSFGAAGTTYAMAQGLRTERAVFFAPPARFDTFWARFRAALEVPEPVWDRMVADSERWLGIRFAEAVPIRLAPAMHTPLLVFHDPEDREVPFEEAEELVAAWPAARLVSTPGTGHLRGLSEDRCRAHTIAFLQGRDVRTAAAQAPSPEPHRLAR